MMLFARLSRVVFSVIALALLCSLADPAHAVTIDWVTVDDAGNAADITGYGAVAESFRIMKYEFTNQQYTDFLNTVAATDTYSLYNASMGGDATGGITRSGASGSYTYAVKPNMGNKPATYLSWWDGARVANWLMNGAAASSSTETGAYTLNGAISGAAPTRNSGATCYIPTEDQWYMAAYYKGGSTNAGYWDYAAQSDTAPATVTALPNGDGSAGSTGNFANYGSVVGNVTTVGTNGGPSAYGAFDMQGNMWEWNDLHGAPNSSRGLRGGDYYQGITTANSRAEDNAASEYSGYGFRLAAPVAVPEPSTSCMALAGLACGGYSLFRRRRTLI